MADEAATAMNNLNLGTASAKDKTESEGRQRGSVRWFNASKGDLCAPIPPASAALPEIAFVLSTP